MVDWSAKNETRDLTFSPSRRFRISTTDYLHGSGSATFPSLFSKGQWTHPPLNQIFRDTHHYAWSDKELQNFQSLLRQVRHILSDPLEYWYLTLELSSGNIILLLTWSIMPHSKPNSSPSFGIRTKNVTTLKRWNVFQALCMFYCPPGFGWFNFSIIHLPTFLTWF